MKPATRNPQPVILLTIDVEDWFQVENFKPWIPFSTWEERELRVERNVHRLLDLFDSVGSSQRDQMSEVGGQRSDKGQMSDVGLPGEALKERRRDVRGQLARRSSERAKTGGQRSERPINPASAVNQQPATSNQQPLFCPATSNLQPATRNRTSNLEPGTWNLEPSFTNQPKIRATFFILGWIAERLPAMVREIHDRGHEVASHGLEHELPSNMSEKDFLSDLVRSRERLEDLIGARVCGYRAPSFAINDTILGRIQQAGYLYDSSYNSFALHGRYGRIHIGKDDGRSGFITLGDDFYEIPLSNINLFHRVFPLGGGGYFRLFPTFLFNAGIQRVLAEQGSFVFYMHPWEIDPEQPKVSAASFQYRFRHYVNLHKTEARLRRLIRRFPYAAFIPCAEFLFHASGHARTAPMQPDAAESLCQFSVCA